MLTYSKPTLLPAVRTATQRGPHSDNDGGACVQRGGYTDAEKRLNHCLSKAEQTVGGVCLQGSISAGAAVGWQPADMPGKHRVKNFLVCLFVDVFCFIVITEINLLLCTE